MKLITIDRAQADAILTGPDGHYLGVLKYQPRFCITTPELDALAVYSWPIASSFKKDGMLGEALLSEPLELIRLWQSPGVMRGTHKETGRPVPGTGQFLAASLRWLRKLSPHSDCVFSYADPGEEDTRTYSLHQGTVYKATNFTQLGASRVTDYWEKDGVRFSSPKMYREHKTKSRQKLTALGYTLIERPPKILYVYGLQKTAEQVRKIIGGRYARPA